MSLSSFLELDAGERARLARSAGAAGIPVDVRCQAAARCGQLENALVPLESSISCRKDFPGVSEQIGTILQTLALNAAEKEDYPQAHHHLERLKALYPRTRRSPISRTDWNSGLRRCSPKLKRPTRRALCRCPGPAETAVAMWPKLKKPEGRHKPIASERYQRMHVGVVRLTASRCRIRFRPMPSCGKRTCGGCPCSRSTGCGTNRAVPHPLLQ